MSVVVVVVVGVLMVLGLLLLLFWGWKSAGYRKGWLGALLVCGDVG